MGRNFYTKSFHTLGMPKQVHSMTDEKTERQQGLSSLLDHGGIERDLQKQGLIDEQSETVPVPLTFVSFYNVLLSFFYFLCTFTL